MRSPLWTNSQTIARSKMRAPLLKPISREKASKFFIVTENEAATLEIYFDQDAFDSLSQAIDSARTKSLLGFDEVF